LYTVTGSTDPYRNLAAEDMLMDDIGPDDILLYLWQNDNTIVIGRNQNAWQECRLDAFAGQGGRLARRLSGGGAVYHDLGNQNFTFFAQRGLYNVARQTEVIRLAARKFGIAAEYGGRNDILAEGRKFSGNAFYSRGRTAYHHGTILIASDLTKLSQYLVPSPGKLAGKGIKSVRSRVVNLQELSARITPQAMRLALLEALEEVYQSPPVPLSALDAVKWDALTEHYASDAWRLGRVSQFTHQFKRQFSFGEFEFQFGVRNGMIESAQVFSDALDANWVSSLSARIQGSPYTANAVAGAVLQPAGPDGAPNPPENQEIAAYLRSVMR
jgi:lipoate-protein ligase A